MDRMKLRPPVGRRGRPCPRSARLAHETVTLFKDTSPGGTSHLDLDEVIGDVGSASLATQLLSMLNTDLKAPTCSPNGSEPILLPGSSPQVTAAVASGEASSGAIRTAKLFAAQGSELLCLTWTSQTELNATGANPEPMLPSLPDALTMAKVLDAALARMAN